MTNLGCTGTLIGIYRLACARHVVLQFTEATSALVSRNDGSRCWLDISDQDIFV